MEITQPPSTGVVVQEPLHKASRLQYRLCDKESSQYYSHCPLVASRSWLGTHYQVPPSSVDEYLGAPTATVQSLAPYSNGYQLCSSYGKPSSSPRVMTYIVCTYRS